MRPLFTIFSLLVSFLFSVQVTAQSLYDDAHTLVAARNVLEENGYNLQDSAAAQAFAKVMAILYTYDNPMAAGDFSPSQLAKVPNRYRTNPGIPELLPIDSLVWLLEFAETEFIHSFQNESDSLRAAPRQKMVDLLRGDYGSSPAEYLSVSRALRQYSVPPIETSLALEQMASESNQNVINGIVNPQAIIEGLFQFVLQRAQEEVVMNFMERFLTEDLPRYEELFPTVVQQFNAPGFSYSHSFVERVRDAFYEDLQLLSVRFPNILLTDERFKYLQDDPLIYNLLAVYSIVGMTQNEVPMEEILPMTFRNLYENYLQNEKKLNFRVAEAPVETPEYTELIRLAKASLDNIKSIYLDLEQAEAEIAAGISRIQAEGEPLPEFATLMLPAYDLDMIMGSDTAADFRLNLLPSLLGGHLDTAYILGFRNVNAYDKFFAQDLSPEEWKAAGLQLARNLNGTWFADYSIDQLLRNWATDLTAYHLEFEQWKRSLDPDLEMALAFQKLESGRVALAETILSTRSFWEDHLSGSQGLAFDMLAAIISDSFDPEENINAAIEIVATGEEIYLTENTRKLLDVEERLLALNDNIAQAFPDQQTGNPLHQYLFEKKSPHPFSETLAKIDQLRSNLFTLKQQLDTLDRQWATTEVKIMENARPMLGLTESLTHLMYCLRSCDGEQKWITKIQLDSILSDPDLRDAFLGLLYQRMCQVQNAPQLSPEGLANLVQLTVADLPWLLYPMEADTSTLEGGLSFYYPAAFLVNTLNRVLEIPLIIDPAAPGVVRPLAETHPALATVPEISELVLDLIYYLNARDHRHAMSSAIRLFLLVENLDVDESVHGFLQEYGFFIADLVDAETGNEVQSLLNGIADPPGSSRLKRRKDLTVGLNAYLGGSLGRETWSADNMEDNFFSIAPTMPIGISLSGLIGNAANPPSFSLFLSFLDLGSMLAFRGDPGGFGETKITFKNMFKPSMQIHYNLPRSPFYIGAGAQIGPHYQDLNGDELSVRTTRFFLNFGVDVPIKTFFVK